MRTAAVLAILGLIALAFGALTLASGGSAYAEEVDVEVDNFYFCDAANQGQVCETDITAGDTITWSVEAGSHTVTQCSDETFSTCPSSGGFDSAGLSSGETFQETFTEPGTYYYYCTFHPSLMKGKITVSEVVASPTPTASPTASASAAATASATPTAGAVPQTGGPAGASGASLWVYVLVALGVAFVAGSTAAYLFTRRN